MSFKKSFVIVTGLEGAEFDFPIMIFHDVQISQDGDNEFTIKGKSPSYMMSFEGACIMVEKLSSLEAQEPKSALRRDNMRQILINLFGLGANNILVIQHEGREWALVRHVCDQVGIGCEYHAVEDQDYDAEFNLTEADKVKLFVPGVHRKCPVWFVSIRGLWKVILRSRSLGALRFRRRLLMQHLQGMITLE